MHKVYSGSLRSFRWAVSLLLFIGFAGVVARAELYETFDTVAPTNLPAEWSQIVVAGTGTWQTVELGAGARSASNVVRLVSAEAGTNVVWLVSTAVTVGTNFVAQFYLRIASTNGMASLSLLASTNGADSVTNDFTVTVTNGIAVSTNWTAFSLNISTSVVATGTVYFAFAGEAADGALLDLDNVLLARGLVPGQVEGFESGLGEGWFSTVVTKPSGDPKLPVWEGTNTWQGQSAVFYNAKELIFASTYSARLSPLNHLHAGGSMNMVINFDMYHYPEQGRWPVYLYPEYSLDDGQTWNNDGSVFLRDTDDYLPGWSPHRVVVIDAAFADASSVRVGLRASHERSTGADLHISNVSVDFMTLIRFSDLWTEPSTPIYGDQMHVFVDIERLPASDVIDLDADLFYRIGSTGDFMQVAMTNITNDVWRSFEKLPACEAGVTIEYYVSAPYGSASGKSIESPHTNTPVEVTYRGLGSVWINEVFYNTDASSQFIEIAGPAERAAIQGWSLDVVDLAAGSNVLASYSISTNFADEVNGYGFYLLGGTNVSHREATLTNPLPVPSSGLRLVNSDGIVEHTVAYGYTNIYDGYTNIGSSATNKSLSAVGYGAYVTNLWEGYSAAFSWTNAVPSPSSVTNGQGFLLEPMQTTISGLIYDAQSNPTNGIPFALVDVSLLLQGGTQEQRGNENEKTALDGGYTFLFTNLFNDSTGDIDCVLSALAFGYAEAERISKISISPYGITNQVDLGLTPVRATDSFSGPGLAAYWGSERIITRTGVNPDWYWDDEIGPDGESGVAVYNASVTPIPTTYAARLRHGNPLNSQNMQVLTVEYWMKHTPLGSWDCTLALQYSTNTSSGSLWHNLGEPVYRNNGDWAGLWRRHRFSLDSEYFVTNQLVHVGLRADNNRLSPDMLIDDLRVTFGVDVLLSELAHAPLVPRYDESLDLRFGLLPVGVGVSNVMVDVVWSNSVSGGGWQTNALTNVRYRVAGSTNAWSSTNLPLAMLSTNLEFEVLGAIAAQPADSELSYYVQVGFDGPGAVSIGAGAESIGDRGIKYLPDNAAYSNGLTTLHGPYLPDPESVGISGIAPVWVNEIFYQTDPTNQFIELAGVSTLDLTNWTLSVMDLSNVNSITNYSLSGLGLTNNVSDNIGFLVLGGSAVTNADASLGAALPAVGGLLLYDADTNLVRSVSYGVEPVFGFDYAGLAATNEYLAFTGTGNPVNGVFAWTNNSGATIGAINTDQQVVDNADPVLKGLASEPLGRSVTSLVVQVNASVDFSPPIWYAFSNQTASVTSDWQQATVWTNTGLSTNTAYTYVYRAADALTNRSEESLSATYYTLLDTPNAPVLAAISPTSLQAFGSVTNLGQGGTAIRFAGTVGDSDWTTNSVWEFTHLSPNTSYDVSLWGLNGDGIAAISPSATTSLYTHAAVPAAAPVVYMKAGKVWLSVTNVFDASAKSSATEYAVGTYGDGDTNYLDASGVVTNDYVWQASTNWAETEPLWAQVSVSQTNHFFLIARNGDGIVTEAGPSSQISLDLSIEAISAVHLSDGLGHVNATAVVLNPASNNCYVALQYSRYGAGGPWNTATIDSVSTPYGTPVWTNAVETNGTIYQIQDVATSEGGTNTITVVWDARADLGTVISTNVWLIWNVLDTSSGASSISSPIKLGSIDLLLNLLRVANGGLLQSYTSQHVTYTASRITDGNLSTFWQSQVTPSKQRIVYSFGGQAVSLSRFRIVNGSSPYRIKDYTIAISVDYGATWTDLYSGTLANSSDPDGDDLDGELATWVRLEINSGYSSTYWQLAEFELYGYTGAPAWWRERGVVTGTNAYDYSVLNAGQLKWMATNAYLELEQQLAGHGGAGTNVAVMVANFSNANNYKPVNLGHLKTVAQPFYDRLHGLNPNVAYPWSRNPDSVVPNDYAVANVGQLKNVFSFALVGERVFAWPAPVVVVPEDPVEE